ncbi:MAG: DUF4397 domain-containing protein [Clostridia bacterium]|nr:DUF4397 domain-containing protein [Clostridia bacterium]
MDSIRIENFLHPYVRFLNASPTLASADFYHGNTLAAPNMGFGCFSSYVKVPRGTQEFKITEAGNKDKVIATLSLPFNQGEVYTVAAVHSDGVTMAYGIAEPTNRENTDYGHLRICHLSPSLGDLDISANGHKILGNIDYLEISKYMCISPGKYEFRAIDADSGRIKLAMPCQFVRPGKYNTVYIVGAENTSAPLMGLFSVDAASYTGYYL